LTDKDSVTSVELKENVADIRALIGVVVAIPLYIFCTHHTIKKFRTQRQTALDKELSRVLVSASGKGLRFRNRSSCRRFLSSCLWVCSANQLSLTGGVHCWGVTPFFNWARRFGGESILPMILCPGLDGSQHPARLDWGLDNGPEDDHKGQGRQ
jgi:hypothetical protein